MSGYEEVLIADRRRAALLVLRDAGGSANSSVLTDALRALGHSRATRDQVRADFRFFADRGLVTLDWVKDDLAVATITQRGLDVAAGREIVSGIKAPEIVG